MLRRKVVSLKNIYVNESHSLCTLEIYTIWKYWVEISHTLMEISLNLKGFTDFSYKEMFTSLISFSPRNTFSLNLLLKQALFKLKVMSFYNFFLCGQLYRFREISQTSKLKSTAETSASTWCIHFDGLCNYLLSFQKQPATISLKITAASLIRNTLSIISTNLLKQDLNFSSNTY